MPDPILLRGYECEGCGSLAIAADLINIWECPVCGQVYLDRLEATECHDEDDT